jgi:ribosome-associated translation inhibitor RaiA
MKIQVNTDSLVEGNQGRIDSVSASVTRGMDRFKDQITRIEVHLSADKPSAMAEQQCAMEVRIENRQPITVTHKAPSSDLAVKGAIEKMKSALVRSNGRNKPF